MNTNDTIARSTQIAIETEQLGNNVLTVLNEQGERLTNANDQVFFFRKIKVNLNLNLNNLISA